ncbi:MAG: cytochrome c [Desulfuromonadales bacterium]|nr:cytochrome c [Desulfuromonadales bacterium]
MQRLLLLLAGMTLLLCACRDSSYEVPQRTVPTTLLGEEQSRSCGEELFFRLCRECHGTLSEGRNPRAERFVPPAPDFHERHYSQTDPAYLYWRIEEGKRSEPFRGRGSVMPAWKPHLSERQIWCLVAYLQHRAREER